MVEPFPAILLSSLKNYPKNSTSNISPVKNEEEIYELKRALMKDKLKNKKLRICVEITWGWRSRFQSRRFALGVLGKKGCVVESLGQGLNPGCIGFGLLIVEIR